MVNNMAEKIVSVRTKNFVASVLHVIFNVVIAAGAWGLLWLFPDTPWPAIALVAVSKYRVFMVKPRYWLPNLLSGLVDFILGIGIVLLMWVSLGWGLGWEALVYQGILVAGYVAWLLVLKPSTKSWAVLLQAVLSQFVGLTALFSVADYLWAPVVVLLAFGIGFATARHALMIHKEPQHDLLAMFWGLVVAQLAFLAYHWSITYTLGLVKIPEIALIVPLVSFVVERFYNSARHNDGQIKQADVLLPTLFATIFIVILLVFFSGLLPAIKLV